MKDDKRRKTTDLEDDQIFAKFIEYRTKGVAINSLFIHDLTKHITNKKLGRKWYENWKAKYGIIYRIGGKKEVSRFVAENDDKKKTSFIAYQSLF